jgi:quercetin dioxygenase-like cupin family protein
MASPVVLRPAELPVMDRGSGVHTVHLVGRAIGASEFINGTSEFEPGGEVAFHSHNCEESIVILEGVATFEPAEGEAIEMTPGDTTWVPAGVVHRFRNRGDGPMKFLFIYGRVDATRTMAATGKTFPIGSEAERAPG